MSVIPRLVAWIKSNIVRHHPLTVSTQVNFSRSSITTMSTGELDPRSNAKGALKIEELQEAAAATFARPEFRHICWAGVFGSVAKGTSNENSDVDVIVSAFPEDPSLPPFAPFLQDVLPRIWARPVDVIWIKEGQKELRGFIQLEALLSSRTIYLQDDHARDEVRRLRLLASSILYEGHHLFTRVTSRIHDVTKLADCISFQVYSAVSSLFQVYGFSPLDC